MACLVEIWEMVGDRQTVYTPACLTCGWIGSGTTNHAFAEEEGRTHEESERPELRRDDVPRG